MLFERTKPYNRWKRLSSETRRGALVLVFTLGAALPLAASHAAPLEGIQAWSGTRGELQAFFMHVRDARLYTDPENPEILRRIPWNEPETCFVRAEAVRREALRLGKAEPTKLFLHGNPRLGFPNPFDSERSFSWKYHVVAAYRLEGEQGGVFVLDPTTERNGPAPLATWLARFDGGARATLDACAPSTYGIHDRCERPEPARTNPYWSHPSLTFEAYLREALRLERAYLQAIDERTGSKLEAESL